MKPNSQFTRRACATVLTAAVVAGGGYVAQAAGSPTGVAGTTASTIVPKVAAHGASANNALSKVKVPAGAVRFSGAPIKTGAAKKPFGAAAPAGDSPRVVGGTTVTSSAYPGVVGIETTFWLPDPTDPTGANLVEWLATCTGTVVSASQVLTAGHCDTDLPYSTTYVVAGRSVLDDTTSGDVVQVESTWTDPQFNEAALNAGTTSIPTQDVSLLDLLQPLPSIYTPVSLTAQGNQTPYAAGTTATVVGYGETTAGDSTTVGTLTAGTVTVQSDATCSSAMPGYAASTMTCAGTPPPTAPPTIQATPTATATTGTDSCNGDSGGPLFVNGAEAAIVDWGDSACGTPGTYGVYERLGYYNAKVTAAMAQPPVVNPDFTGNGHSGIMAVDSSGELLLYTGSGLYNNGMNGFDGEFVLDPGVSFSGYRQVFQVMNWNGDGSDSVMAVGQNGNLYEWPTDGQGDFLAAQPIVIGTGWQEFNDIMIVNNWTGDGHADLIGRMPNGNLRIYVSNGTGGWENGNGVQIGTGWNEFNTILTPGAWNGDGKQVLLGRNPNGNLVMYESDGKGGWTNPAGTLIGTGWTMFRTFMAVGDWDGIGTIDLIGVTPSGNMAMYETDGKGNWLNPAGTLIGTGWSYSQIF